MVAKLLDAQRRHKNAHSAARFPALIEKSPLVGLLPNGESRARCAPGIHHFGVRPALRTDPLQKIENERIDGVRFGVHRIGTLIFAGSAVKMVILPANPTELTRE
jgi:hypothetical protein